MDRERAQRGKASGGGWREQVLDSWAKSSRQIGFQISPAKFHGFGHASELPSCASVTVSAHGCDLFSVCDMN